MPPVDPPTAHLRREGSLPRRRTSDPIPRRRDVDLQPRTSVFGAFLIVLAGVGFLGYVFNIAGFATSADQLFAHLNASAQRENDLVVHMVTFAYPAAVLLVEALFVFVVIRILIHSLRRSAKRRRLAGRQVMSLETFKRITGERGIRPRIAAQAYELMLPYYSSTMRARLDDRLLEDLGMTPAQVSDVYSNLLRNTDRKPPVGSRPSILTVMDLLNAAQNASRQSLMNSVVGPVARLSGMTKARHAKHVAEDSVSR